MKKTKIICTLGPATAGDDVLRALMLGGMDVARLNFSHGDHEQHAKTIERIDIMRKELGLPVATLLDTRGPEIRICTFAAGKAALERGQKFTLTTREVEGNDRIVSITYKDLPKDVCRGMKILIDDGLLELEVLSMTDTDIECKVENGGIITDRKGVNVPGSNLSMDFISRKDYDDLVFGAAQDVDYVAASFTRNGQDIMDIRKILDDNGGESIKIIAKIENKQGVDNIEEIAKVADGVMVARGDMGVEIPFEEVPVLQKMIIKKVLEEGKAVITATQMLDSMMKNPRPTRAEAADVANAIYDGTSAIMLSGETAAGAYPVEALETMVKIAEKAEADINYAGRFFDYKHQAGADVTKAISHATCSIAIDLSATAIITLTASGRTARMISKYRPFCPIIGCTMREKVWRQLSLNWGVIPLKMTEYVEEDTEHLFTLAVAASKEAGYIKEGDLTISTAGLPLGGSGKTNILKANV